MRALLFCFVLLLAACDPPPESPEPSGTPPITTAPAPITAQALALREAVEQASEQRLRRLNATATGFADAITGLLDDPAEARLATAQQAWEHFYAGFNQAAVILECRAQNSEHGQSRLSRSDRFPILPGYIDSLARWPGSGIVNDTNVSLTREALLEQQGATSDAEASLGFQVIQFLLFGEPDRPRAVADLMVAPAEKPATDSDAAETVQDGTDAPVETVLAQPDTPNAEAEAEAEAADEIAPVDEGEASAGYAPMAPENQIQRRRAYLATATELLVEDILLLAHDNSAAVQPVQKCPVTAMRRVTARLLLLANLDPEQTVAGDYMAINAQNIARQNLHQALTTWLDTEGPLANWAFSENEELRPTLEPLLASPPGPQDVQALQQLHAVLTTLGN